jgi:4-hydroxy-tetrahydrodipicolinate reductase
MLRIAVSGVTGRMGQSLVRLIEAADDLALAGGIGSAEHTGEAARRYGCERIVALGAADGALAAADALVDFSSAAALAELLERHGDALAGRALVIGTTGLDARTEAQVDAAAERSPTIVAANFSIGVHVRARLVEAAAGLLGAGYDVEIVEAHHRHKVDAPSGTALRMGEIVAEALGRDLAKDAVYGREGVTGERTPETIGFSTIRGGDVVGDHTVMFIGTGERVEITHRSSSSANYAQGALRAARFLRERRAGLYDMWDVLGLR